MPDLQPFAVRDTAATHVIIELFGGDNNLNDFVVEDMQEMVAGNHGPAAVLGLADFEGRPATVVELSPRSGVSVVEEWGEIDTGDPETLATFISRALATYGPEVKTAIGFWDHGTGTFDEYDPNEVLLARRLAQAPRWLRTRSRPRRRLFLRKTAVAANPRIRAMLHDDTSGGLLTNLEAGKTLAAAFRRAGRSEPADLIFSDTCLNGMVEVLEELGPYAHCIVGSEELEPGDGWDYYEWLRRTSDAPPADGHAWGQQAVAAFEAGYRNRSEQHPCTLGAFRSENGIADAFKDLIAAAHAHGPQGYWRLEMARGRSQSFAQRDTYDMRDFAEQVKAFAEETEIKAAAEALVQAFDAARVHAIALGPTVPRSHGLAFWFPSSQWAMNMDGPTYERLKFAQRTGWMEYLKEYR